LQESDFKDLLEQGENDDVAEKENLVQGIKLQLKAARAALSAMRRK